MSFSILLPIGLTSAVESRATPNYLAMLIILKPLLITSVMSSSDNIIEGPLITVGEKHKEVFANFHQLFSFFFVNIAIIRCFGVS